MRNAIHSVMNRCAWHLLFATSVMLAATVCAETESIDLKALAKKARPAVLLLVVSDATGKEIATGTGFLVSSDGKLITNHHVIEGAASAVAKTENGGLFPVEGVLADDPKNDLVLLKLKGKDMPFLPLGNSDKIEVGTRIAVIGSPLGLEGTMSEGIVSAVRELMGDMRILQVTAAISPGSSGSPVINSKSEVIGVASALLKIGQALNFAVPVECASRLLAKIKPSAIPQPLAKSVVADEDKIFADPDLRSFEAAEAAEDGVGMLKSAKALVARYPESATAYFNLGWAFEDLNFINDAITAYRQAIKIDPNDAGAWGCLCGVYRKSGRIDDAITACQQSIKIKPNDADVWSFLGQAYEKSGRIDDAIFAYRQAIKFDPKDGVSMYGLAAAYAQRKDFDEARKTLIVLERVAPEIASEAWHNLGVAYNEAGRIAEARDAFQRAERLKP